MKKQGPSVIAKVYTLILLMVTLIIFAILMSSCTTVRKRTERIKRFNEIETMLNTTIPVNIYIRPYYYGKDTFPTFNRYNVQTGYLILAYRTKLSNVRKIHPNKTLDVDTAKVWIHKVISFKHLK